MQSKNKPSMSAHERDYITNLKSMACGVCNAPGPSDAHELEQGQWFTSIPLCRDCHMGVAEPINRDESMDRDYIPLPGGWELQTKGEGSTLRLLDKKAGERHPLPLPDFVTEFIERMGREIYAAVAASPAAAEPTPVAKGELPEPDEDFFADVYDQCCRAIKPAVDRGLLPGSVVESLQMLVAEKLATPPTQAAAPVAGTLRDAAEAVCTAASGKYAEDGIHKAIDKLRAALRTEPRPTPPAEPALPDTFSDKSTAAPVEKARRVLNALASKSDFRYFFDDGFPRAQLIADDAKAVLAVIEALAALAAAAVPEQTQWAADRYNWLREHSVVVCEPGRGTTVHVGVGFIQSRPALLDLAIDDQRGIQGNAGETAND